MTLFDELGSLKRHSVHLCFFLLGHTLYTTIFNFQSDTSPLYSAVLSTILFWQFTVIVSCLFYWTLDNNPALARSLGFKKLLSHSAHAEPPWSTQVPIAYRNMAGGVVFIVTLCFAMNAMPRQTIALDYNYALRLMDANETRESVLFHVDLFGPFHRSEREGLLRSLVWMVVYFLISDVLFYSFHYLMHKIPSLWTLHETHHSSHAQCAIAGYYMSLLDFYLEHMPIFLAFCCFRECGPAWVITISFGTWNLLTTHSGWDSTFTPDPVPHFLHHSRHNLNYGIVLDHIVGTAASLELMDKTRSKNNTKEKKDC